MKLRTALGSALALVFGTVSFAAVQDFSFKGNALGMSLDDFRKTAPASPLFVEVLDGRHKKRVQLTTPVCTDAFPTLPAAYFSPVGPGEVACVTAAGAVNPEARTVAGIQVDSLVYRFYAGKLWEITFRFSALNYPEIAHAFAAKYGAPKITTETHQNGFGATWTSQRSVRQNGNMLILLSEGPGNGPGQDQFSVLAGGSAVISDPSIGPPAKPTPKPDF